MNLTLHLSPEIEAKLLEQARSTGRDVESLAIEAVREKFATVEEASTASIPADEWLRLFDVWVSEQQSRNPRLDDSRDSMYPDRW